jgi:hypothetical protein
MFDHINRRHLWLLFIVAGFLLLSRSAHGQASCYTPEGQEESCCAYLGVCDCSPDEFSTCYIGPIAYNSNWTTNCQKTEPHATLWGYSDATLTSDGQVEGWSVTYNADGVGGQVAVVSYVTLTMPDGTKVPEVEAATWASPLSVAYTTQSFSSYNDTGAGQVYGIQELDWRCGWNVDQVQTVGLGMGVSTLKYTSISNGQCTYTLQCPNGNQNASCQSGPLVTKAPCPFEYLVTDFLVVRKGKSNKSCFGTGPGAFTNTPANCS